MSSERSSAPSQGLLPLVAPGQLALPKGELFPGGKLPFDATRLSEALKYQVHVAIDYCHTLKPDDVLWIEVYGDVTVEGREQVEVKDYHGDLTDSHENIWKTLNNWLNSDFRQESYVSLVLLTTQKFGDRAALERWNEMDADQRLVTLERIHQEAEKRHKDRSASRSGGVAEGNGSNSKKSEQQHVPGVLKLQRLVMRPDVREVLKQVLAKVKLITKQPDLLGLIDQYKMKHLRAVLPHRQDEFLDDLFGFMTNAMKMTSGWSFKGSQFTTKFADLTKRYMIGTVKFPCLDERELGLEAQEAIVRDRLYVKKLDEIGAGEVVIQQATIDRLSAEKFIVELYKDGATSQEDVERYSNDHLRLHCSSRLALIYRSDASLTHPERQRASCAFYHDTCARPVTGFGSFDQTPVAFRNGIYHLLADQDALGSPSDFQWRLWE